MSHTVTSEPRLLKPNSASSLPGMGQHTSYEQKALSPQIDISKSPGWPHTGTTNFSVPSHYHMIAHLMQVLSLHICRFRGTFSLVLYWPGQKSGFNSSSPELAQEKKKLVCSRTTTPLLFSALLADSNFSFQISVAKRKKGGTGCN